MAISHGVSFFTEFKNFFKTPLLKMTRIVKTTFVGEENMFSYEGLKISAFSEAYISSILKKKQGNEFLAKSQIIKNTKFVKGAKA
jgi:hypothetical protein